MLDIVPNQVTFSFISALFWGPVCIAWLITSVGHGGPQSVGTPSVAYCCKFLNSSAGNTLLARSTGRINDFAWNSPFAPSEGVVISVGGTGKASRAVKPGSTGLRSSKGHIALFPRTDWVADGQPLAPPRDLAPFPPTDWLADGQPPALTGDLAQFPLTDWSANEQPPALTGDLALFPRTDWFAGGQPLAPPRDLAQFPLTDRWADGQPPALTGGLAQSFRTDCVIGGPLPH